MGIVALLPSTSQAKSPAPVNIEIFDDRKAKADIDRLVDSMDIDLPFAVRDGLTQVGFKHTACAGPVPVRATCKCDYQTWSFS